MKQETEIKATETTTLSVDGLKCAVSYCSRLVGEDDGGIYCFRCEELMNEAMLEGSNTPPDEVGMYDEKEEMKE